mmetsp:Transcript_103345/g.267292  ORF Transcript_103345/g.267292 Transcript_103345/m.267292 type:complete len:365 (+) Transcript_103345:86-1180(+)
MTVAKLAECKVALSLHDMLSDEDMLSRQTSYGGGRAEDLLSRQTSTQTGTSEEESNGAMKKNFQPYHAQSVPKPENLEAHATVTAAGGTPVTTMMLRNIPNKYTQNTLLQEIDDLGFAGTYDFFYLPMDVHNRSNVGYAFINFLTPIHAERFRRIFSDHRFQRFQSRKISSVCTAHVQGLDANLRHFENRAVTHSRNDQYRPIVLKGNVRIDFEEAVAAAKGWVSQPPAPTAAKLSHPPAHVPRAAPALGPQGDCNARLGLEAAIRDLLTSQQGGANDAKAAPPTPPGLGKVPARYAGGVPEHAAHGVSADAGSDITQLLSLRNMLVGRLRETDSPSYAPKASALSPSSPWESPAYITLPSTGF